MNIKPTLPISATTQSFVTTRRLGFVFALMISLIGCSDATGVQFCAGISCTLDCPFGFVRDASGCLTCSCLPSPNEGCTDDDDCVVAYDATDCCGCGQAFTRERLDVDVCVYELRETPPAACEPPGACAGFQCDCPLVIRATCEEGLCVGHDDCPEGEVRSGLGCAPACETHSDCVAAADYGSCCGGCGSYHAQTVENDPCLAASRAESSCSPAPGACDGLGCASPPESCAFDTTAVCMTDGTCQSGGLDQTCPPGSTPVGEQCTATTDDMGRLICGPSAAECPTDQTCCPRTNLGPLVCDDPEVLCVR